MKNNHVEFISYTGKYPNLCRGILTLKIDGKEVSFGHDYAISNSWNTDGNYNEFWVSGGTTYFTNGWNDAHVEDGEWIIYKEDLPEKYKKYYNEIKEVFNDNVPFGCCGGCI